MSYLDLSTTDRTALEVASLGLPPIAREHWAIRQFETYRSRGYGVRSSVRYALANARNMTEQRARRVSHGTGATGWTMSPTGEWSSPS